VRNNCRMHSLLEMEKAAFATTSKLLITYKYFEDCQFT